MVQHFIKQQVILGVVNHHPDYPDQGSIFPPIGGKLQVNGEDASGYSQDAEAERDVWR